MNSQIIDLKQPIIPDYKETKTTNSRFVSFGSANQYPQQLRELSERCVELQSIINGMADYITGEGIEEEETLTKCDRYGTTFPELIRGISSDYVAVGSFALQIIRNRNGRITDLVRLTPENIRLSEDEETIFYCDDWKSKKNIKSYPAYKRGENVNNCILYYKTPRSLGVYGIPVWNAAISSVLVSIEIDKFNLSQITNNFLPSTIIRVNSGEPDEETKRRFYNDIERKFCGSDNAARLLVTYAEDRDHNVEIERLAEDSFDTRYQELQKTTREKIFMAFRATPQLFGLDPERSTFNSVEYSQSFKLFNRTMIQPIQREIERAFNLLGIEIHIKPFEINFDNEAATD